MAKCVNVKCIVVGDEGVGKTCLLTSYGNDMWATYHDKAVSDGYEATLVVGKEPYTLFLFDSLGQDKYDRLRPRWYTGAHVFLLCFSITSPASLDDVKNRWYPEVRHHSPGVPFLIMGTQIDQREDPWALARQDQPPLSTNAGERLAQELGAVKYVECSAVTREGLKNVFDEAIAAALEPLVLSNNKSPVIVLSLKSPLVTDTPSGASTTPSTSWHGYGNRFKAMPTFVFLHRILLHYRLTQTALVFSRYIG
jgi:cell division control protein 42